MTNTLLLIASVAVFQQPAVTAFTDVTVIPMDRERTIPGQTVIVRDGRIAEIGPANRVRLPAGATSVDGRGKFLMPGLAEMHAHIPGPQNAAFQERVLYMYLAGGVTTIRGMLGQPNHLQLREQAAAGQIWSPTIYTSGPSLNGNSAPSPDVARRMVEEQRQAGYDLLKIHPGLSRAAFDTMAQAAHRVGISFSGHVPADVGVERALTVPRYSTIDHIDGFVEWLAGPNSGLQSGFFGLGMMAAVDESRVPEIVRRTREAGVWIVPTQTLFETMAGSETIDQMRAYPGMDLMPPQVVQQWVTAVTNNRSQAPDEATSVRRWGSRLLSWAGYSAGSSAGWRPG